MKKRIYSILNSLLLLFILFSNLYSQDYKLIESDDTHLILEFDFTNKFEVEDILIDGIKFTSIKDENYPLQKPGDPFLPTRSYEIGIPQNSNAIVTILSNEREVLNDKFVISAPDSMDQPFNKLHYNQDVYSISSLFPIEQAQINSEAVFRYIKIASISVAPFQFNPVQRTLVFNKKISIRVDFKQDHSFNSILNPISDKMTEELVKSNLINSDEALTFIGKTTSFTDSPQEQYWYDPNKDYFKIYLKTKGIYRLSFEYLVSNGLPIISGMPSNRFNIYNNGSTIPLDIVDNGDSTFDEGDYIDFVGYPPTPTPFTTNNIYNFSNIYWLSYQENVIPHRYKNVNGLPSNYNRTLYSSPKIIHFEKDSLYEPLGYAPNANRDYWYWGKATAQNRQSDIAFVDHFNDFPDPNLDSNWVTIRVQMHGMTNNGRCNTDHKAEIKLTDQLLGSIIWDGQTEATFEKRFYSSSDSIAIYPFGNELKVSVNGESCPDSLGINNDDIRINWYEFEYERANRVNGTYFDFKSPKNVTGINRHWLWQWQSDSMKILIPQKSKMIKNPLKLNDVDKSFLFADTVYSSTEYFCISENSFNVPDSILRNISSDLRNIDNGADYIIITHPKFFPIANQLADFRSSYFPDENISTPRIKVVDIEKIYDEFSYGLLDPYALKNFVKYAFENWTSPAPLYIVLVGDMSHDYKGLLKSSRPNFIPSIPYFASGYGQAASDNMIVAISSPDDVTPDLAIGRISIETVEEGNIILQKIMNYPADNSKSWKQNNLLLASGMSDDDQRKFGFNQATMDLRNNYVSKRGYRSSIVLNFPDSLKPEQEQYRGGGPKIREQINQGAVLVNYYGHGGGYQWDLTFKNDDIYTLENGNRLPIILSVTCYTAHFDDQDVFGEQFNKVEGKGSVGFLGSSALTYWSSGVAINNLLFGRIFNQKDYIIGKAVLFAKNQLPPYGANALQIALLAYLGDPVQKIALPDAPDFVIINENLTITPQTPVIGDSVLVQLIINNLGTTFPNDSVLVEIFAESTDTSYFIGSKKIPSFALQSMASMYWYPTMGGLYTITVKVNESELIEEIDHSDNVTANNYFVFNISDPAIIKPIDGYSSENNEIEFIISDVGYYANKDLRYFIEIDTSTGFVAPIKVSDELTANKSIVKWNVKDLNQNTYFWRARIFDGTQYGKWSDVRSFSLNLLHVNGYYASKEILKTYSTYNVEYNNNNESLVLNTDTLPARPSNFNLIEHFVPDPSLPDSLHLTALTTDGTYLYFGNLWYTANHTDGLSQIYRVGTGNNNTEKGHFYGPFSTFYDSIKNTITYHSDGNIYVAIGLSHKLVRINVSSEIIDTIDVPPGLLRWDGTNTTDGPIYLTSNGKYIYNITLVDSVGNQKYTVRTFDPSNGWSLVNNDLVLDGYSFNVGFTGFFVHGDRIYPSEYYSNNFLRRYRLTDGFFEEEWTVILPISDFQSYYSWCYDWTHDNIYASVYRASGYPPKFSKFPGYYVDANGSIITNQVGPANKWNYLKYNLLNPSNSGQFDASLLGYNSVTKEWEILQNNIPDSLSLNNLDPAKYTSLKINFNLSDSTFNLVQPLELKSVHFGYDELSDIYLENDDISFEKDSIMQGLPLVTTIRAKKIGYGADSLSLNVLQDSTNFNFNVKANQDSISESAIFNIETSKLLFSNNIELSASQSTREYYYYNNNMQSNFYIVRDSIKPNFTITFDGQELIDGDVISSEPEIIMTLEDNSPLPLSASCFEVTHTHNKIQKTLNIPADVDSFVINPYPNSSAQIIWRPKLEDGEHTLTIYTKDASLNPYSTSTLTYRFNVFNDPDLLQVYNYPNPFKDKTDFTFELRGIIPPEELKIKIFTVAGRLIREIVLPGSELQIGFNKIFWDGKDQDGDEIANGVYFYKIISKHGDQVKTVTQKLAKLK